jgi:cytochrome c oxidase subunit I
MAMTAAMETVEAGAAPSYLRAARGLKSWIFTLDHKRIGIMYLVVILASFLAGGVIALLMRLHLLTPKGMLFTNEMYNRLFTLHGALMIFLFIIPSIPAILGNFLVPLQIGAKDVAFPRLNLASWWLYMIGAVFALYSIIAGSADTGWTFYTPYSSQSTTAVSSVVLGVFILGFSSIFTGINMIVTIHKLRAPGMTWNRMPLFIWSIYATAIIQVLATPVLGITLLLLVMERALHIGIFDSAMGGDPLLFQHFFWFYSHPAVYIMILPGMGIISELIAVHSRKRIFGYRAVAMSSVAIAVISFLVWGHHMFVSGQSQLATMVFSFLTFAVAIPSAIKVFNWTATLYRGAIRLTTPMLYALSFLFLFAIGGLTGIFLGALAIDVHVHDTYFVVAHFHYVMMGGTVIAFLGGLHHWWPKMFGRMYSEAWGRLSCALIFVGFNLTFFTQFLLGTHGMPRRYAQYLPKYQGLHDVSTVGSMILGLGFFIMAGYLVHSLVRGRVASANPWGGKSLEWTIASPPPLHNFHDAPHVTTGPYEFDEIEPTPGDEAAAPARP